MFATSYFWDNNFTASATLKVAGIKHEPDGMGSGTNYNDYVTGYNERHGTLYSYYRANNARGTYTRPEIPNLNDLNSGTMNLNTTKEYFSSKDDNFLYRKDVTITAKIAADKTKIQKC